MPPLIPNLIHLATLKILLIKKIIFLMKNLNYHPHIFNSLLSCSSSLHVKRLFFTTFTLVCQHKLHFYNYYFHYSMWAHKYIFNIIIFTSSYFWYGRFVHLVITIWLIIFQCIFNHIHNMSNWLFGDEKEAESLEGEFGRI